MHDARRGVALRYSGSRLKPNEIQFQSYFNHLKPLVGYLVGLNSTDRGERHGSRAWNMLILCKNLDWYAIGLNLFAVPCKLRDTQHWRSPGTPFREIAVGLKFGGMRHHAIDMTS